MTYWQIGILRQHIHGLFELQIDCSPLDIVDIDDKLQTDTTDSPC